MVIVDDGIATGATVKVALQALRAIGAAKRVLAVPVAPRDVAAELQHVCDELVVLRLPHLLGAVGRFYDIFNQLEDTEVVAILDDARRRVQLHEEWREPVASTFLAGLELAREGTLTLAQDVPFETLQLTGAPPSSDARVPLSAITA